METAAEYFESKNIRISIYQYIRRGLRRTPATSPFRGPPFSAPVTISFVFR